MPPENEIHVAAALPGWEAVSATLHLLGDEPRLPRVPAGTVRLLEPSKLDSIEGLPSRLRSEFAVATRRSPIAASLAGGRPVVFLLTGLLAHRGGLLQDKGSLLKKVAARTREALVEAIGLALEALTSEDAEDWFAHCGYQVEAQWS